MPHKLLLADDSVTIQRVIELTFADEDVQVIAVGNGQQAIERAEREKPDIVLADIGMPERDGYEVAAFIKSHPSLSQVPVVLLTGAFEPIDEARARAVGCDGVLVKPFEPQMVISRVKDLLSGRRPSNMWSSGPAAQGPIRPAAVVPAAADAPSNESLEAYFDRLDAAFSSIGTPPGEAQPHAADANAFAQAAAPEPAARTPIPLSRPAAAQPPRPPAADALESWDPDLEGDPAKPSPVTAFPSEPAATVRPFVPHTAPAEPARTFIPPPFAPPPAAPAAVAPAPVSPAAVAPAPAPVPFAPAPQPAATSAQTAAPQAAPQIPALADAFAALLSAEERVQYLPSAVRSGGGAAPANDPVMLDAIVDRVLARLADSPLRMTVLDAAERLVKEEIARLKGNA
jgi:CheY-like chemotaxis protein